ncbi:MAG TPA: response regulator, partial [Acidobacteriota bacterium]|nr:response regulator [Acidobacteriota bacterium]
MVTMLIVDDELSMREVLERVFRREGYTVHLADNGARALEMIRDHVYDLVLSDVRMPTLTGMELLAECRHISSETMVILMTAYGTVESAREAFKMGADDFIQKPFDIDEIKLVVRNALEKSRLRKDVVLLRRELSDRGRLENIIGRSTIMQNIFRMIETVAPTTSTVLITGESG